MRGKINIKKIIIAYVLVFTFAMALKIMIIPAGMVIGEFDDYTLMSASLINDFNFTISQEDLVYAEKLFPEWASFYKNQYALSPYVSKGGDQLAWYAPTYSMFVIPFIFILKVMNISTCYAYRVANLFFLITSLLIVIKKVDMKDALKLLMIMALTIHPIVLLLVWPSAEVFLFGLILLSVAFWSNRQYKWAALFCSLAGTLNVVIMIWGIVMIIDYFLNLSKLRTHDESFIKFFFLKSWKDLIGYGYCYLISVMPIVFNYYQIGHINLSGASMTEYDIQSVIGHFIAYFVDLNFGFLPYFSVLLILDIVVFLVALANKKSKKYVFMLISLIGITFGYSMMVHINCGMSAISRYNSWNSIFIIFIAFLGMDELINRQVVYKVCLVVTTIGVFATFGAIKLANESNYVNMLPTAKWVLDNYPSLYNPLHSTFNSRVSHVDGGYSYKLPLVYYDDQGLVRKILLDEHTVEDIRQNFSGSVEDTAWLNKELNRVDKEKYISISKNRRIERIVKVTEKDVIQLSGNNSIWNGNQYIKAGISGNESWGTWTDGNRVVFTKLRFADEVGDAKYNMIIHVKTVFSRPQKVVVLVNEEVVHEAILQVGAIEKMNISFQTDKNGDAKIELLLPNAVKPVEVGEGNDGRTLGLGLSLIEFKKNI